jgi:hypothetical protein
MSQLGSTRRCLPSPVSLLTSSSTQDPPAQHPHIHSLYPTPIQQPLRDFDGLRLNMLPSQLTEGIIVAASIQGIVPRFR